MLRKIFKEKKNIFPLFRNRVERAEFVSRIYKNFLKNSVLDVGCSEGSLKNYISQDVKYIGIDISGSPDITLDLEKDKLKIFEDDSFYTVVCTDVLEHLENIHEMFDDICRVSQKYVIISLPNNWANFKFSLMSGKDGQKFYGLPIKKPFDRHKWFFNYEQANTFLEKRGEMNNFKILKKFSIPLIYNSLKHQLLNFGLKFYYKNRYGYNNLFYNSIWVVLKKINQ